MIETSVVIFVPVLDLQDCAILSLVLGYRAYPELLWRRYLLLLKLAD